jgi:hypothetical protein
MKKCILIFLLVLISAILSKAQTPQELLRERKEAKLAEQREYNEGLVDTSGRYFYKTYGDYVAHNAVQGIKYTGQRKIVFDTESVLVLEDDDFTYKKIKELRYWGFIDQWGQLERIFNNHCYFVLDTGKICSYVKAVDTEMTTDKNGNRSLHWLSENPDGSKDYISSGLDGPIMDFSEKKFKILTASYPEVFEEFQKEAIDNKSKDKRSLKTFKIKKYCEMYNKKM